MCVAAVCGLFFGGMIGARHAGDKYITLNHSSKFTSVMQAQVRSSCLAIVQRLFVIAGKVFALISECLIREFYSLVFMFAWRVRQSSPS